MTLRWWASLIALLAATLYALSVPLSKILFEHMSSTMTAAMFYLGAGFAMVIIAVVEKRRAQTDRSWTRPPRLVRSDLPYTIAMVVLDIAAPILLLAGVARTQAATVSLLNNFEIVATALIALVFFGEKVSRRLWVGIGLVLFASVLLTADAGDLAGGFSLNSGALLALAATVCWGVENNCTRKISDKDSTQIVLIKGLGSGTGSLTIALALGDAVPAIPWIFAALVIGAFAFGLSIKLYIVAQRHLGAAKTSAFYSVGPFIGVFFSFVMLREHMTGQFILAAAVMVVATVVIALDTIGIQHTHEHVHVHTHEHSHGDLVHTHPHAHAHSHTHAHGQDMSLHEHTHPDFPGHDADFPGHGGHNEVG